MMQHLQRMRSWRAAPLALALLLALLLAVLLGGCAGLPQAPASAPAAALPYKDSIEVNGRISVQYEQNNQPQSLHGSFNWSQQPRQTHLDLLSPLGQTVATIDVKPGIATLVQSGRSPQVAADVDQLAEQALGWPLPVSGLRQWLQGTGDGADGKPFHARAGDEYASFTTRDGWRVVYATWEGTDGAKGAPPRPKRIDLSRETEQAGKVSIRIAIDGWQAP